jgi:hypothetical protein
MVLDFLIVDSKTQSPFNDTILGMSEYTSIPDKVDAGNDMRIFRK